MFLFFPKMNLSRNKANVFPYANICPVPISLCAKLRWCGVLLFYRGPAACEEIYVTGNITTGHLLFPLKTLKPGNDGSVLLSSNENPSLFPLSLQSFYSTQIPLSPKMDPPTSEPTLQHLSPSPSVILYHKRILLSTDLFNLFRFLPFPFTPF